MINSVSSVIDNTTAVVRNFYEYLVGSPAAFSLVKRAIFIL